MSDEGLKPEVPLKDRRISNTFKDAVVNTAKRAGRSRTGLAVLTAAGGFLGAGHLNADTAYAAPGDETKPTVTATPRRPENPPNETATQKRLREEAAAREAAKATATPKPTETPKPTPTATESPTGQPGSENNGNKGPDGGHQNPGEAGGPGETDPKGPQTAPTPRPFQPGGPNDGPPSGPVTSAIEDITNFFKDWGTQISYGAAGIAGLFVTTWGAVRLWGAVSGKNKADEAKAAAEALAAHTAVNKLFREGDLKDDFMRELQALEASKPEIFEDPAKLEAARRTILDTLIKNQKGIPTEPFYSYIYQDQDFNVIQGKPKTNMEKRIDAAKTVAKYGAGLGLVWALAFEPALAAPVLGLGVLYLEERYIGFFRRIFKGGASGIGMGAQGLARAKEYSNTYFRNRADARERARQQQEQDEADRRTREEAWARATAAQDEENRRRAASQTIDPQEFRHPTDRSTSNEDEERRRRYDNAEDLPF